MRKIRFSFMICGAQGTGRTTFINSICEESLLKSETYDPRTAHIERAVQIRSTTSELEEPDGSRIAITVVDTPGFGDNVDNTSCCARVIAYLESKYDEVLAEESRIRRNPRFRDNRIHACLYFIEWTGHGLRELDMTMMQKLSRRANVIPVISKADALTPVERSTAKKAIMDDIEHYGIPVFKFDSDPDEVDEESQSHNDALRAMLPFAIATSTEKINKNGHISLGRVYPWGVVDVEDPRHSDYVALREALLGTHLNDLKDLTHDYYYEAYRTQKLSESFENPRDSKQLNPEDLATQSYTLKEEQLFRDAEKLREVEIRMQQEIQERKLELSARESELREIESRISRERSLSSAMIAPPNQEHPVISDSDTSGSSPPSRSENLRMTDQKPPYNGKLPYSTTYSG
jgi:cell division control protein 11